MILALSALLGFSQVCSAQTFLENEAGISASVTLPSLNLQMVEGVYKNIERRDADFIVGSVAVDGYPENYDVHVYSNSSGDVIAYYLKAEPAAKIINWINYSGTLTLQGSILELALTKICTAVGQVVPEVTYYDFRYPGGTNFKVIADEAIGFRSEYFSYLIPSNYIIREASCSLAVSRQGGTGYDGSLYIDDVQLLITSVPSSGWGFESRTIDGQYLIRDVYHEVRLRSTTSGMNAYGAVFFIYNE